MAGPGFEFVEGATADLAFVARGATVEDAFIGAGKAFLAATVDVPETVQRRETRSFELEEPDLDLLLMMFLNELIYLRDTDELLMHPERITIDFDASFRLRAELRGERIDHARHRLESDVKAATAHGLHVKETSNGWTATATLDV